MAEPGPVDRELLTKLLQEEGVVTTPGEPGRLSWLGEVLLHAWDSLAEGLRAEGTWGWVAVGVLALLTLSLLGFFGWVLLGWRRARRAAALAEIATIAPVSERLEKDRVLALLSEGRRREAAALGWRWLVEGLSAAGIGEAKPDQTHGEFVRSVRRKDPLWPSAGDLGTLSGEADRLCYAPSEPTVEGVEAWIRAAEQLRTAATKAPVAQPPAGRGE